MASAWFNSLLAPGEIGGAAFGTLHPVFTRVSRLKFRRFAEAAVVLGCEATPRFLKLALAVTGMTSSLATCRVNLDECLVFGNLRRGPGCGLWDGLLTSFLAPQALLRRRPVDEGHSQAGRFELLYRRGSASVYQV